MTEEQKASTEPVSVVEPVSPPTGAEPVAPLTEERVQQLITEARLLAIEEGKNLGKREMQSIKDREVAEASRRARQSESRLSAYEGSLSHLDEETRTAVEQARLREENKYYQDIIKEEETRRNQDAYANQLRQSLRDEATALGLDPEDKRIDFAVDEGDYFKGRQRFIGSLSKILKENQGISSKKMEDNFKTMELSLRKELGLDSIPPPSGASVDTSDAAFIRDYNAGLRNNPADHKRAQDYLNKLNK